MKHCIMRRLSACLVVVGSALTAFADANGEEPAPTLEERIERAREDRIASVTLELEDLKKRALATRDRTARQRLSQRIKATKASLRKLENKQEPFEPQIDQFDNDEFGQIPSARLPRVLQVIDDDEVIVRMTFDTTRTFVTSDGRRTETGSIASILVWLKGHPTDGLRDGGECPCDGYFLVAGTHQYGTANGTNTVPLVVPVKE